MRGDILYLLLTLTFCRSNSLLQLIRSRYQPPSAPTSQLPFQLDRLEEDIVSTFIVGKPLIEASSQIRKVFKFKEMKRGMGVAQE